MKLLTIFLFCCFSVSITLGQAPQAFNYQAVARDAAGSPLINQSIGIQFNILSGSSMGAIVYSEVYTVTTNSNGLFNIQVGNGTPVSGNFSIIDWGANDYFLQVALDPNGGSNYQIFGTSQLLSVPYALHAGNGSKWSESGNDLYYNTGFIGIGESNPQHRLSIKSDAAIGDDRILIEGVNTSPGNAAYSSIRLYAGTNGNFSAFRHISNNHARASIADYTNIRSSGEGIYFDATKLDNSAGVIKFIAGHTSNTFIERMRLSPVGNLGIGTAAPASRLQVANGDVFIQDINNGVIMKSPNGQCWRYTPDNTGQLVGTPITCPN